MLLTPRYGSNPVIVLDGAPAAIAGPVIRQRQRLASALERFSEGQWRHPSRCEGWSNRDVIIHLDSTNTFWAHSISSGVNNEPTELLATFDPVASPAELVEGSAELSSAEVLERFRTSTAALIDLLGSLDDEDWRKPAEAPPGHLSMSAVAHHALWDSWVHERDVLLPLGLIPDEENDEVTACLRYAAALGPALALNQGLARPGIVAISATEPTIRLLVEIGDRAEIRTGSTESAPALTGPAVKLVEAFSTRDPFPQPLPSDVSQLLSGLAEAFEVDSG